MNILYIHIYVYITLISVIPVGMLVSNTVPSSNVPVYQQLTVSPFFGKFVLSPFFSTDLMYLGGP